MEKRHTDLDYLMALGHNALEAREGRLADTRFHLTNEEYDDYDTIDIAVDLAEVERCLGQKTAEDWFVHFDDENTFTSGMSIAQRALMLGHIYSETTPSGWAECLDCSEGCEQCHYLAIVPVDMLALCPACSGEGILARGSRCHHCDDGTCWKSSEDDIRSSIADEDDWQDYQASTRRMQEAGTL